jgi:F0F1-type ATP synthase epsilon subunit
MKDVLFEGESDRITSYNEVGPFDIYPMHANFISIIQKGVTIYLDHKVLKELKFEKAVMKVKQDSVKIFLGIETLFGEETIMEEDKKRQAQNTK